MASFTTQQIAARVSGELTGPADAVIVGVERLEAAGLEQISFIRDHRYAAAGNASKAGALLVGKGADVTADGRTVIRVPDADLAMAVVLEMFAPPAIRPQAGIHPRAIVEPSAKLGAGAAVGAGCYVGANVRIGEGAILHPNVTVLDESVVGPHCELHSGVVVRERCELGTRVILHLNVSIGGDGFGYRPSPDPKRPGLVKIPQIGTVIIGNDVEIGAGSCVDRATFSATIIGDGTKIDNLCQIAHNCVIGRMVIISGICGIAGSVTIGDGALIGGAVVVKDHVTLGAGCRIAACAAVMDDIPAGETWGGYPAQPVHIALREHAALRKLPEMIKLMKKNR